MAALINGYYRDCFSSNKSFTSGRHDFDYVHGKCIGSQPIAHTEAIFRSHARASKIPRGLKHSDPQTKSPALSCRILLYLPWREHSSNKKLKKKIESRVSCIVIYSRYLHDGVRFWASSPLRCKYLGGR